MSATTIFAASDSWVEFSANNFPDKTFRDALLYWSLKSTKTSGGSPYVIDDTKFRVENGKAMINRDMFTEIDINKTKGTFTLQDALPSVVQKLVDYAAKTKILTVDYPAIKKLDGIKLFRNVMTITLPNPGAKNRKTQLTALDVSGMPILETITNLSTGDRGFPYSINNSGATGLPSAASGFTCPVTQVIADDCPLLREVRLSCYTTLKKVSFKGSDNIVNLYLVKTGIETLDISNLTKLFNEKTVNSWNDQDFDEAMGIPGYPNDAAKMAVTFALNGCSELTDLNLGDVNIHILDVSGCNKLKKLDVSGQTDLYFLFANMSTTTTTPGALSDFDNMHSNNHVGRNLPAGAIEEVILGPKRIVKRISIKGTQIKEIDLSTACETLQFLNLSTNNLQSVDLTKLRLATSIEIDNNRIRSLKLPKNHNISTFHIGWNCLTTLPQYDNKYTGLSRSGANYAKPFQIINIGENDWRVRVLDKPEDNIYVMKENSSFTNSSRKPYYYAPKNCRMGDPAKDEYDGQGNPTGRKQDPCYLYFFNSEADADAGIPSSEPRMDAFYYYSDEYRPNDTKKNPATYYAYNWFKVYFCRHSGTTDEIIDLPVLVPAGFYLVSESDNWAIKPEYRFSVTDEQNGIYGLTLDSVLQHEFRIHYVDEKGNVIYNYGGHESDYPEGSKKEHVYFKRDYPYKLGTDLSKHYTTHWDDEDIEGSIISPSFVLRHLPGEDEAPNNYVMLTAGTTTSIATFDIDNVDAEPIYYNLQGMRVSIPVKGAVYIRRCGNSVNKIIY